MQFQSTAVRLTDLTPSSRATTYKGFAVNFSWGLSYTKPDDLSGSIRQVSAKLRWRKNGAPAYTEYIVNNATQGYTIPAGVLPAGDIDWQVEVTDTSGGTTASSWTTFNNKELPVTPADLYPADGGRVLKHQVNRFGWSVTAEGAEDAPGEIVQTSAVLRYRTQGQQDVKSVTISGAQTWHDFPANTFTADDIEWQVEVTANTGAAGTSEWIHVNTQDALSTPVCVSPVGAIVEDTQGVTFVWRHEISTGTAQTAYELQTSSNMGGQYTTLSTAETDASSFATPAGQFAQGTLMWRVRTKNGDGVWGSYLAMSSKIETRLHLAKGTLYTAAIQALLVESGITDFFVEANTATLQADREDWEPGTDRLTIINALAAEINYNSIWMDGSGTVHCSAFRMPSADAISVTYRDGEYSIQYPEWSETVDMFDHPNVFIVEVDNPDLDSSMRAVSVNDRPDSVFSTVNLGRRVVSYEKLDNIASQAELQAYADNKRFKSLQSTETRTFYTGPSGRHAVFDLVELVRDGESTLYEETGWRLELEQPYKMTHTGKRVVYL